MQKIGATLHQDPTYRDVLQDIEKKPIGVSLENFKAQHEKENYLLRAMLQDMRDDFDSYRNLQTERAQREVARRDEILVKSSLDNDDKTKIMQNIEVLEATMSALNDKLDNIAHPITVSVQPVVDNMEVAEGIALSLAYLSLH